MMAQHCCPYTHFKCRKLSTTALLYLKLIEGANFPMLAHQTQQQFLLQMKESAQGRHVSLTLYAKLTWQGSAELNCCTSSHVHLVKAAKRFQVQLCTDRCNNCVQILVTWNDKRMTQANPKYHWHNIHIRIIPSNHPGLRQSNLSNLSTLSNKTACTFGQAAESLSA